MIGLRKFVLVIAVLLLTFGATRAQETAEPLVITPPAGPIGTNHNVTGFDLEPNKEYILDVIFRETDASVFSTPLVADDSGAVMISLFTEPSDELGIYDVLLYDGDTIVRAGTITITEGERSIGAITGTLRPNLKINTSLTDNISADYYEFEAEAGDIITIDMESDDFDAYMLLLDAAGMPVTWDDSGGDGTNARIQTFTIEQTGSYLLAATSRRNILTSGVEPENGEYSLLMRPAREVNSGEIFPGEIIVGEIGENQQVISYSFEAPANAVITIELGSEDFDPLLHLFSPGGSQLARDDDSGAGLNAKISEITLTEAGEYSILVDAYRGETGRREISGQFTIIFDGEGFPVAEASDPPANTGTSGETDETADSTDTENDEEAQQTPEPPVALEANVTVEGTIGGDNQTAAYTFTATAGEIVNIQIEATGFDSLLRLLDASGQELISDDDSGSGLNAAILDYEIPADGEYTIIVDGYRGADGSRDISGTFELIVSSSDDDTPDIVEGTTDNTINYGDTLTGELNEDTQHVEYRFEGNAGDTVTISLSATAFDTKVSLLNTSGEEIAADDDGGEGLNSLISEFTLPADGAYTIVVDGYRGANNDRLLQGEYTLSLLTGDAVVDDTPSAEATPSPDEDTSQDNASAPDAGEDTIAYGEQIEGELNEENQQITHTFTGNAGDVVTIAVNAEGFDALTRLLNANGNEIAFDDDSGEGLNALINSVTLPADGQYTIVVDGYRGANNDRVLLGTYTLSLILEGTEDAVTEDATPQPEDTSTPDETVADAIPEDAQAIAYGETLTGMLTNGTAQTAYVFTGSEGDVITIDVRSDEFDPTVELLDEMGAVVAFDDDSGGGVQSQIAGFEIIQDGTYYIVVDNFNGFESDSSFSGTYTVALSTADAPAIVDAPDEPDDAIDIPETDTDTEETATDEQAPDVTTLETGSEITYGTVVEAEFTGEAFDETENIVYSFEGQAGEVITVRIDSEQVIDTRLWLMLDDTVIATDDDSGAGFDPEIYQLLLSESGTYTIIVESEFTGASGAIQLELIKDAPLSLDENAHVIRFSDKAETNYNRAITTPLMFEGNAGTRVRIIVDVRSPFDSASTINALQDGEVIASTSIGQGSLQVSFDFIIPEDGTVYIDFTGDGLNGVLEITLETLP